MTPVLFTARNGAERLASHLAHAAGLPARPNLAAIRRFSDIILASDFLDPTDETMAWLDVLSRHGVRDVPETLVGGGLLAAVPDELA